MCVSALIIVILFVIFVEGYIDSTDEALIQQCKMCINLNDYLKENPPQINNSTSHCHETMRNICSIFPNNKLESCFFIMHWSLEAFLSSLRLIYLFCIRIFYYYCCYYLSIFKRN